MSERNLFVGTTPVRHKETKIEGKYVEIEGEKFYKISGYDGMKPFFMSIVSAFDHWMFVYSNGGITAGKENPDNALFPYDTDDKIRDTAETTGSKTIFRISTDERTWLWEPFSDRNLGAYNIQRNIYKNLEGCKLIFEEHNLDLGLSFRIMWSTARQLGFVKRASLISNGNQEYKVEVLDGIQNILPYGVDSSLQQVRSTLADAYKRNEQHPAGVLAYYTLSSMIVDKAEPSEALRATTAFCVGLDVKNVLLCSQQLNQFRLGAEIKNEVDVKAEKGAYFAHSVLDCKSSSTHVWYIVADLEQSHADVVSAANRLQYPDQVTNLIEQELREGKEALRKKIGSADGIQVSADKLSTGRHFSNVLFNIMRGGTFDDKYLVEVSDLRKHVKHFNRPCYIRCHAFLDGLPDQLEYADLTQRVAKHRDVDLVRLCMEYLPLSFSRRHGDPSRPWNQFHIEINEEDGKAVKKYEGNWRDIFQNWEALALSYPEFIEGMIAKFVNASTSDGYNPYRITSEGIDWEVIEPDDPWSYIGYWGDHQIIYLLKLMEISASHHPNKLKALLIDDVFVYANVPYKIKGYDAILVNPSDTIDYDHTLDQEIKEKVRQIGADGKLVCNQKGEFIRANLTEKLLVTSLTKLYNFIPEAGIWLNTQRPEWNDANNALVGNGVSMVTLYYLKRFLRFGVELFDEMGKTQIELNKPVYDLMDALHRGLKVRTHLLDGPISDEERRKLMDRFGIAGEHYRTSAYSGFQGLKSQVSAKEIVEFFELATLFVEHSIKANKRDDGLYHSYNILSVDTNTASIGRLYEMLEGQVAVLSSKMLAPEEALNVLHALKASKMFRTDQYSYMLYPDRQLPSFLQKNVPDQEALQSLTLIRKLVQAENDQLVEVDQHGILHFCGDFHNAQDLNRTLDRLAEEDYFNEVQSDRNALLSIFEATFNHKSFTGRSGTFFGYEGLGCIYWHMVSKLLLATQENIFLSIEQKADAGTVGQLIEHYYEIRAGIGVNKSPELYGAFPTDAYSHTRKTSGAQQPGMTGQVKEDVINRWAELGVVVRHGAISFQPHILRASELLSVPAQLEYYDTNGAKKKVEVKAGEMAFTYCQVPVIYKLGDEAQIQVVWKNGNRETINGLNLPTSHSQSIFRKEGDIVALRCTHISSI